MLAQNRFDDNIINLWSFLGNFNKGRLTEKLWVQGRRSNLRVSLFGGMPSLEVKHMCGLETL